VLLKFCTQKEMPFCVPGPVLESSVLVEGVTISKAPRLGEGNTVQRELLATQVAANSVPMVGVLRCMARAPRAISFSFRVVGSLHVASRTNLNRRVPCVGACRGLRRVT
jgi:hypothetical protein